jgi:nucleotide-binding universal stress UspA family protein
MEYLLATASVHTTAAAADWLADRLRPDDRVTVLGVLEDGNDRDVDDALNVARVRLPDADLRTERRSGVPDREILAAIEAFDADHVVVGLHQPDPDGGEGGLGTTAAAVLVEAGVPVTVLPA